MLLRHTIDPVVPQHCSAIVALLLLLSSRFGAKHASGMHVPHNQQADRQSEQHECIHAQADRKPDQHHDGCGV